MITKWNNGDIPVLLGQPQSMGHGLNLQQGGHHVCFYSLNWSYENYDQSIRRIYRQGNESKKVIVYHLIAKDTIDELMLVSLNNKEAGQNKILELLKQYASRNK